MNSGKEVFFVTNSSHRSRLEMCDKLRKQLNNPKLQPSQMVPSCYAAASHIKQWLPRNKKVYVIGGQGIVDELALVGIETVGGPARVDDKTALDEDDIEDYVLDKDVACVLIGTCMEVNFRMIAEASM
jgi:ribonucleotide monophosphatase NagD (HAD superfamily)